MNDLWMSRVEACNNRRIELGKSSRLEAGKRLRLDAGKNRRIELGNGSRLEHSHVHDRGNFASWRNQMSLRIL